MTGLEAFLVIVIIALIIFVIYYYFRGSSGQVQIGKPMESRVDEYLDRRFEMMIEEWSLIPRSRLLSFRTAKDPILAGNEEKVAALKNFHDEMNENLGRLEDRLNALEKQLGQK
jgi:hypothetical protein